MPAAVVFPVGKEDAADAYLDFCNLNNPDTTPGSVWYLPTRVDAHGQRVVGYLGPEGFTWNSLPFPEPEGGPEARSEGVIVDHVEWPVEEEV